MLLSLIALFLLQDMADGMFVDQPKNVTAFVGNDAYFGCYNNETGDAVPGWYINDAYKTKSGLNHMTKYEFLNRKLTVHDVQESDNNTKYQCVYLLQTGEIFSSIGVLQVVKGNAQKLFKISASSFTLCFEATMDNNFPLDSVDVTLTFQNAALNKNYEVETTEYSVCDDLDVQNSSCLSFNITMKMTVFTPISIPSWTIPYQSNNSKISRCSEDHQCCNEGPINPPDNKILWILVGSIVPTGILLLTMVVCIAACCIYRCYKRDKNQYLLAKSK